MNFRPIGAPSPLQRPQGEAVRYGTNFTAARQLLSTENGFEDSPDRRNERRTTSQKDMVDVVGRNAGVGEQPLDAPADLKQFLVDPFLKLYTGQWSLDLHDRIVEPKEAVSL